MGFISKIGDFISNASGVISSVINANNARKMQEREIEQRNNEIKNTNAFNMQMYNDWKEFNSPAEQMKRLEAAGVNPNLAAGMVSSGNVSSPFSIQQSGSIDSSQPFGSVVAAGLAALPFYVQRKYARQSLENRKALESVQVQSAMTDYAMKDLQYSDAMNIRAVLRYKDYDEYKKFQQGDDPFGIMSRYQFEYYRALADKQRILNENVEGKTSSTSLRDYEQEYTNEHLDFNRKYQIYKDIINFLFGRR